MHFPKTFPRLQYGDRGQGKPRGSQKVKAGPRLPPGRLVTLRFL